MCNEPPGSILPPLAMFEANDMVVIPQDREDEVLDAVEAIQPGENAFAHRCARA